MPDSFGSALRVMRDAAGLSLAALARRANVSKSQVGNLETGTRPPTIEIAEAIDRALRAGGVLIELAAAERGGGDDMRRRALLATIGAAASLGTIAGPHALGDMVRHGLLDAAGTTEDWDAVIADSTRRLVSDPSPQFGAAMLTNLMILRQQLAERPDRDAFQAAARLGQVYGLWLGNQDQLGGAGYWYRSAAILAERSGDLSTQAWVLGRSASRGVYEGWTAQRTLDTAAAALELSPRPTPGAFEAHAARAEVYALTGNLAAGRQAVEDMMDVAERLPGATLQAGAGSHERAVFFRAFLECWVGDRASIEAACDEANRVLAHLPMWLIELQVYRARAMVAAGDVSGGITYALQAISGLRYQVRVIAVAVRNVCQTVPANYRGDDLAALWQHADRSPGPWETIG